MVRIKKDKKDDLILNSAAASVSVRYVHTLTFRTVISVWLGGCFKPQPPQLLDFDTVKDEESFHRFLHEDVTCGVSNGLLVRSLSLAVATTCRRGNLDGVKKFNSNNKDINFRARLSGENDKLKKENSGL